jgi:hypothetical protein
MPQERFGKECQRLTVPPSPEATPDGLGTVQFVATCPGNASQVLSRTKELLLLFCEQSPSAWPSLAQWRNMLPRWFLDRCAPEMTQEQAEKWLAWWRGLPPEERERVEREKDWSLENWLYWMEPANRTWTWWDACDQDANTLIVAIEVIDWPFPWGAFRWLLLAAGAEKVEEAVS